ncbi:MAG: cytochrome b/b6 domain-containing protein [Gammaproteobacteria bacterium]|nr:cytochrome b/b6 domain-containing protein [Gammaproteobacteria bacterium]MCW8922808.1 cytochrome b/b6 domain-containing protein [Gammaproteobacteria bacterium]
MNSTNQIKVWDPLVRVFHWTLASAFFIAYLTEDDWMNVHAYAGYTIGALIMFRLLWGFVGTRHARFSDFVRPPREVVSYLKDMATFHPKRYLGHNPAGGAMVVALLVSLSLTVLTGMSVYGAEESAGPLAELFANAPELVADMFEELHEFFANFTLFLVVFHVIGVVLAGLQHGENLVRSMINGLKKAE